MKKFIVLLSLVLSMQIFPQISPTEFPKIGYADMYWLYEYPSYYYPNHSPGSHHTDSSYYYPRLVELGLTHVVTDADAIPLNPAYNSSIKILDNNFPHTSYNKPYLYAQGVGNYINHLPYEVGGDNISLINNTDDVFGFGTNTPPNAKGSWWIQRFDVNTIGTKAQPDLNNTIVVHSAMVGVDNPGLIMKAEFDPTHQHPYNSRGGSTFYYKLFINAKIDGTLGTDNVARIRIYEKTGSATQTISNHQAIYNPQQIQTTELAYTTLTDFTYYVTANDFGGTNYINLPPRQFQKIGGWNTILTVEIEWLGTRNLYIDKISVSNQYYEDLFITNLPSAVTNITNDLNSAFSSIKNNSLFTHLYNDEPMPLMYRAVGKVSTISEQTLGTGKYVNGATMGISLDQMLIANNERRVPYVLYDNYTISHWTDTSSTGSGTIQTAYDLFVNAISVDVGYGVHRYSGLKQAIQWAQNLTPNDPSDDVPLVNTIQVQAEKMVQHGSITNFRFRAPTPYEILAEGNLSLCYGVKGLMYFCIFTDTPSLTDTYNRYCYYGLFDEQNNPYNDKTSSITGYIQNPAQPQKVNERFYAVKSLNQYIDKIKGDLLQLTWTNGFSVYQGQPTGTFITQVTTSDQPSTTYVELGTFKKSDQMTNANLDYFFVVNRRTLSTEQRNIAVTINKSNTIYNNWKVTEVGTSNTWTVSNTGSFTTNFQPGEGKLFKMEPVMVAGGTLAYNENIPQPTTINSGVTLTILPGVNLSFTNGASLTVNGTLIANGTSVNRIIFNRSGPNGLWGSLKFDGAGASSSVLNNVVVKNATNIQILNNANVTIQNSTIDSCTQGIYVYNASPQILNNQISNSVLHGIYVDASGKTPLILNNIITKMSNNPNYKHQEGIIMYNGTIGYIAHNDISGFDHGIYVGGGSNAKFTNYNWQTYSPNNRFTGNRYGIMVGWGSYLAAGVGWAQYWNNSIYNNDYYNIYVYQSSTAYAQYNYWGVGSSKQYFDWNSSLTSLPALSNDPWGSSQSAIKAFTPTDIVMPEVQLMPTSAKSTTAINGSLEQIQQAALTNDLGGAKDEDELMKGMLLEQEGKIDEAIDYLKKLVKNKKYGMYAITELAGLKERYPKENVQAYFEDLLKDPNEGNKSRIKKHLANFYLNKDEDDRAVALFDELKDDKTSKKDNFEGLYEKFNFMLHKKKDFVSAKNLLAEMKDKFADDEEANIHIATAEMLMSTNSNFALGKKQNIMATSNDAEVIKDYALAQNYPNPFNPITTITYQLPKSGSVTLKIYDMLGKEVMTLVNEQKEMGRYTVQFDASSLASGMYVYQLRVNDYTSTKKMLLLK